MMDTTAGTEARCFGVVSTPRCARALLAASLLFRYWESLVFRY